MALVDSAVYVHGERVSDGDSPADAVRIARERGGMVWIGLRSTNAEELGELEELLDLNRLAVKDCLRGHQRSKFERYGAMAFLVVQPAQYFDETEAVVMSEVDFFVGEDFIVTVQSTEQSTEQNAGQNDDQIDVRAAQRDLEKHPGALENGPYALMWALLSNVLDGYRPVMEGVENDIDEIEEQLFSHDVAVSRRIFALQREVIELQHATFPLVDILERLQSMVSEISGGRGAPAFRELDDRAGHVVDRIDSFRHTLESALSVHASLVEQENNEAMRRMTETGLQQNEQLKKVSGWAAILFAPTLVGTIYGMNFQNMPELHWTFGYPLAILAMLATSVTLYVIFKKRGWL